MILKKIPFGSLTGTRVFNDNGGQGTIYSASGNKLVKIYPETKEVNDRLEKISNHGEIYKGLEDFCAVPEVMIESESGQLIGFQMNHFSNFEALGALSNVSYCIKNKISIRKSIIIFLELYRLLELIHNKGFLIIDFNEENVMFRMVDDKPSVAFVDIDSWTFRGPNLKLLPSSITDDFCHPELEEIRENLQPYHDWYSYSVLLARSLIKNDPFNLGVIDRKLIQGTTRRKEGISCWDKRVEMTKEDEIHSGRFGSKLTNTIYSWLSGTQKGVFPKKVLYNFLDGLVTCKGIYKGKQCNLEVHIDHVNCPRCGAVLPSPKPRAFRNGNDIRNNHDYHNSDFQKNDSGIVGKLIANNTSCIV